MSCASVILAQVLICSQSIASFNEKELGGFPVDLIKAGVGIIKDTLDIKSGKISTIKALQDSSKPNAIRFGCSFCV